MNMEDDAAGGEAVSRSEHRGGDQLTCVALIL